MKSGALRYGDLLWQVNLRAGIWTIDTMAEVVSAWLRAGWRPEAQS